MKTRVGRLAQQPRFTAVPAVFVCGHGRAACGIGIYGVVGFLVVQQTRESAFERARRHSPECSKDGSFEYGALDGCRGALGLLGAWLCSRLLESLLFEVRAHDPFLLCAALLVLLAVAFFAAWIPACKAIRVDPMMALRYE